MKTNDIVTVYVAFANGQGGKRRPVLVIDDMNGRVTFFNITTQYEKKSEAMKRVYYPMIDWQKAGLSKQSWIDVGTLRGLSKIQTGVVFKKIGKLSEFDSEGLNDFIENLNQK